MLFLVCTEFVEPAGIDPSALEELIAAEQRASTALQQEGVIVQLWRETGTRRAWGIWVADDVTAAREQVDRLPCARYMTVQIRAVQAHPNSIRGNRLDPAAEQVN